jgi:hypothetical protein
MNLGPSGDNTVLGEKVKRQARAAPASAMSARAARAAPRAAMLANRPLAPARYTDWQRVTRPLFTHTHARVRAS